MNRDDDNINTEPLIAWVFLWALVVAALAFLAYDIYQHYMADNLVLAIAGDY